MDSRSRALYFFGDADPTKPLETPLCSVDHVRVLDAATGGNGDVMCLEVLDRILNHLDANPNYEFINISLGSSSSCGGR